MEGGNEQGGLGANLQPEKVLGKSREIPTVKRVPKGGLELGVIVR